MVPHTDDGMVTPEIIQFINNAIAKGATPEQITTTLLQKGWKQEEIVEALKSIAGEPMPHVPPPTPKDIRQYPYINIQKIENPNRLYAFPFLGGLFKLIILIPVFIEICILSQVWDFLLLLNSFVALFKGKQWKVSYDIGAGLVNINIKTYFFLAGLTNKYPGFGFRIEDNYSVDLPYDESSKRIFAIPILGGIFRYTLIIPTTIIVFVLGATVGIMVHLSSLSVLFTGKYPESAFELTKDTVRMFTGLNMYASGMTDIYPSFKISMNHKGLKLLFIICTILYMLGLFIIPNVLPGLYIVPMSKLLLTKSLVPAIYTMPTAHTPNSQYKPNQSSQLSHFGITLNSPWGAPTNAGYFNDTTMVYTFSNKKSIAISAINEPSIFRVSSLDNSGKKQFNSMSHALGRDIESTDLAFYSTALTYSPNDISLFTPQNKVEAISTLLTFKQAHLQKIISVDGLNKLNNLNGYQYFTNTKNGSKTAVINVFDKQGNMRQITINDSPSQDEVDYIGSSITIDNSQNQIKNGTTTFNLKTSNCQLADFGPITANPNYDFVASLGPCDQKFKDALNASETAWNAKNFPLMKQSASAALASATNNYQKGVAHYWIGLYYHTAQDPKSAIPELLQAIGLAPQFANSYSTLAADYSSLRDYNNGALYGEKCVDIDSLYAYCHSNYGVALDALGKTNQGLAELKQAISLQPTNKNLQGIYNSEKEFYSRLTPTPLIH